MLRVTTYLITGAIAGAATLACARLGLPVWVLFLTWVGYFLFGATPRGGLRLLAGLIAGTFMGWLILLIGTAALPSLGELAFPLAVFLVAGAIPLFEDMPPFDLVPAYFLGVVTFFGADATPGLVQIGTLAAPAALGVLAGWLNVRLRAAAQLTLRAA